MTSYSAPRFVHFIGRALRFKASEKAQVDFGVDTAMVKLSPPASGYGELHASVDISCGDDRSVAHPAEYFLGEASGPIQSGIRKFIATRRITGHLVAVSRWVRR
jgi:hypothetical protein